VCSRSCLAATSSLVLSAEWKAAYATLEDQQVCSVDRFGDKKPVACGNMTTLYSTVVASPATARLAHSCGLVINRRNEKLQHIAALHADIQTLTALRKLGLPVNDTVVLVVARTGRLDVLHHLFAQQRCPKPKALRQLCCSQWQHQHAQLAQSRAPASF
jgi:hypothetical protein